MQSINHDAYVLLVFISVVLFNTHYYLSYMFSPSTKSLDQVQTKAISTLDKQTRLVNRSSY